MGFAETLNLYRESLNLSVRKLSEETENICGKDGRISGAYINQIENRLFFPSREYMLNLHKTFITLSQGEMDHLPVEYFNEIATQSIIGLAIEVFAHRLFFCFKHNFSNKQDNILANKTFSELFYRCVGIKLKDFKEENNEDALICLLKHFQIKSLKIQQEIISEYLESAILNLSQKDRLRITYKLIFEKLFNIYDKENKKIIPTLLKKKIT